MNAYASATAAFLAAMLSNVPTAGNAASPQIDGVVRQEIAKCWNPATAEQHYVVMVRFELNRDGSLATGPTVVDSKPSGVPDAAIRAVLRAVRECTPLKLPSEAYDSWRNVEIKFQTQPLPQPQYPGRPFGASAWPQ